MKIYLRLLPATLFFLLVGVLLSGLLLPGERSEVPSPLLGREVPVFHLEGLEKEGGFTNEDLSVEKVALINVWASWCPPCRVEHPLLMRLSCIPGLRMFGINYKDRRDAARFFLAELGNPFGRIGFDGDGRIALEWGVYGVPETFLVVGGQISYKRVGPLNEELLVEQIMPILNTHGITGTGTCKAR